MSEEGIPQSNALAEATADSIGELLSRDPEDPKADRKRLIQALRDQRVRHMAAEQTKTDKPKKKEPKTAKEILSAPANINPDDLGI